MRVWAAIVAAFALPATTPMRMARWGSASPIVWVSTGPAWATKARISLRASSIHASGSSSPLSASKVAHRFRSALTRRAADAPTMSAAVSMSATHNVRRMPWTRARSRFRYRASDTDSIVADAERASTER